MTGVPYATALAGDVPYVVERRVLAGVPCLVERPLGEASALVVVYHGVTASKEGNLGVFTSLVGSGVAVVLPDSAGHGERREPHLSAEVLGYRNFLRVCAARTALEAPGVIEAAREAFGLVPTGVIGISMGGYTAHVLAQRERRVEAVAVISSGGVWDEPEVTVPFARHFIETHRPVEHARLAPPASVLLLHGDRDPVFPLTDFDATLAAYRAAYDEAGSPEKLEARVFEGVEHYTSPGMRDAAVSFMRRALLGEDPEVAA
ncbi:alpha/beta hydrolase family protein [Deinococcus pimensis]|uniref:alpha/beta hydrolase family protein n=1 Tax=Deinococcus pimensis TaxID=309888 RepID=UPI0004810606|nr:alpha/beta fold hydrolase [Deinococcus pimensis]